MGDEETPPAAAAAAAEASAAPEAAAAPAPATLPREACPFCLEALDATALLLPCGHTFHSVCALQFLLKKKQCITCRAPVDESRVVDLMHTPEASGRQFVPPVSPPQQSQAALKSPSKPMGASPGRIELQAVAGGAAALVAGAEAGAAGVLAAAESEQGGASRSHTWNSPLATSLAPTFSEGGGTAGAAPASQWLPDIFAVPPRSPGPHLTLSVQGSPVVGAARLPSATRSPVVGGLGGAGGTSAGQGAADAQRQIRTIHVVGTPRQHWLRPFFIGLLIVVILATIVIVPTVLTNSDASYKNSPYSRTGAGRNPSSGASGDRRSTVEQKRACWDCLLTSAHEYTCPGCEDVFTRRR